MVFYLVVSIIFTIYTLDLLSLVLVAAFAKYKQHGTPKELDARFDKTVEPDGTKELPQYPLCLIQIPMYNEETFCELIIERCCKVKWPRDRLLIQVLDDSTKESVRNKVDSAAAVACEQGHGVEVHRRDNRSGFKAGALVEGLKIAELRGYEYVAIMDADFDPPEDFLYQTIAPLEANPKLGFIQACWVFVNVNTFLTWAQSVNLNFHHEVEQRARSYAGWFFNFCGTAGVWRIETINDAGGWESDTVVEDMDLSLRAYLKGWDSLYLHHVKVPNELPPTLAAYKTQQFRWLSGPMQILVKCFGRIIFSRNVSFGRKMSAYWFFFRYILFAIISLVVLAIPPIILWVEQWHWGWETYYFIVSVNLALAVYLYVTPLSILYLLFSVAIGYFKTWAMLAGLFGSKKSKSWKVTKKFGAASKGRRVYHKPYLLELLLFCFYATLAFFGLWYRNWFMGGYCCVMAVCFITLSLGDYIM